MNFAVTETFIDQNTEVLFDHQNNFFKNTIHAKLQKPLAHKS